MIIRFRFVPHEFSFPVGSRPDWSAICRDALWSNGLCNWTADFADRDKVVGHRALTPDLYDGTSGIALFLHRLAAATGERIFRLTAEAALRQACSRLPLQGCGLYAGETVHSGHAKLCLLGESNIQQVVSQAAPNPHTLDLISGSGGSVLLSSLRRTAGKNAMSAGAVPSTWRLLLTRADRSDEGLSSGRPSDAEN